MDSLSPRTTVSFSFAPRCAWELPPPHILTCIQSCLCLSLYCSHKWTVGSQCFISSLQWLRLMKMCPSVSFTCILYTQFILSCFLRVQFQELFWHFVPSYPNEIFVMQMLCPGLWLTFYYFNAVFIYYMFLILWNFCHLFFP